MGESKAPIQIKSLKGRMALVKAFFNVVPTVNQMRIIDAIFLGKDNRIVINAFTRYGKSWAVSIGVLLYIYFNDGKRILLVSPSDKQSGILRNYIGEFIIGSPLEDIVEFEVVKIAGKLKKEVSKRRVTFKNGCELQVHSAEGKAERLMGFGGDLIILDESCLIDYEVYQSKISRMLGDNPDSKLVELGNPWHKNNQFWEHWTDPSFYKIRIDYKIGLREGRITRDFVDEQRKLLTPLYFRVLYDSAFPDEAEDSLFNSEKIRIAIEKDLEVDKSWKRVHGLDVAEMGRDYTVLTSGWWKNGVLVVDSVESWSKAETMTTVLRVKDLVKKNELLTVDSTGVGSGVADRLSELGFNVVKAKSGSSPSRNKDRFLNLKAQYHWALKELLDDESIELPVHNKLREELGKLTYEITAAGKIRVIKPSDKSPDFADSLVFLVGGVVSANTGVASVSVY